MKKQKLGDRINEVFSKPKVMEMEAGGETFSLHVHPLGISDIDEIQTKLGTEGLNDEVIKLVIANTVKDADGNPVWEKPEDIKLPPLEWAKLRGRILKIQFNIDLAAIMEKENAG